MGLHKLNDSSSSPFERQNFNDDDKHSQFLNFLRENMLALWTERGAQIHNVSDRRSQYPFPLARIKRIVKSNEKVEKKGSDGPINTALKQFCASNINSNRYRQNLGERHAYWPQIKLEAQRVGADATILIAKACELFVMELTFHAWFYKENEHRTLQHWDIGRAISSSKRAKFLSHIVRAHSQKVVTKDLKEIMFRPAYPLQLQSINSPEGLNLLRETGPRLGNPMHSVGMNPAFSLGNQEIQLFPPSTSSVPLNHHPGSKEEPSQGSS